MHRSPKGGKSSLSIAPSGLSGGIFSNSGVRGLSKSASAGALVVYGSPNLKFDSCGREIGEHPASKSKSKVGASDGLDFFTAWPEQLSRTSKRACTAPSTSETGNAMVTTSKGWLPRAMYSSDISELGEITRALFIAYDIDCNSKVELEEYLEAEQLLGVALCMDGDLAAAAKERFNQISHGRIHGAIDYPDFFRLQVEQLATMDENPATWPGIARWCLHQVEVGRMRAHEVDLDMDIGKNMRNRKALQKVAATTPRQLASITDRIQELGRQRARWFQDKLVLQGYVLSQGAPENGATLEVSLDGKVLATGSSNPRGVFEIRMEAMIGRTMLLVARKPGFATATRRLSGDNLKHIRFELLPLTVRGRFRALPGRKGTANITDDSIGATFTLPVGEVVKDGKLFNGEVDLCAAVADVANKASIAALPSLVGRTVAGAMVPLQALGAVYTELVDPSDNQILQLIPGGTGIEVTLPSKVPLPRKMPSPWRYDKRNCEWEETLLPLDVNSQELPFPRPSEEATEYYQISQAALSREQVEGNTRIKAGRELIDKWRESQGKPRICTCGFRSKRAIMPLLREQNGMELADPPKRVFASMELDQRGEPKFEFPYQVEKEITRSAALAARHPEVMLSQHLAEAAAVLGNPLISQADEYSVRESKFYLKEARSVLPALRGIVSWMASQAHVVDESTGEGLYDVDPAALKLVTLQRLVSLWIKGCAAPAATLHELRELLAISGGDVAEAFLSACEVQARREEVARVVQKLAVTNHRIGTRFRDVEKALDESGGSVEAAAKAISFDSGVRHQVEILRVREALRERLPHAHPGKKTVEKAMVSAHKEKRRLTEKAAESRAAAEQAAEQRDAKKAELAEASASKNKEEKAKVPQLTEELEELETAASTAEGTASADEADLAACEGPGKVAEVLAKTKAVQDKAKLAPKTWAELVNDAGRVSKLKFDVPETGWATVCAPQVPLLKKPTTATTAPSSPQTPISPLILTGLLPTDAAEESPQTCRTGELEFFPRVPELVYPVDAASIVLAAFSDDTAVASASASGLKYRSTDFCEALQPDSSFYCLAMAGAPFELTAYCRGTSGVLPFGPYVAEPTGKVTCLGALETGSSSPASTFEQTRKAEPTVMQRGEIVLPALEFPPQALALSVARWLGTWEFDERLADNPKHASKWRFWTSRCVFSAAAAGENGVQVECGMWSGTGCPNANFMLLTLMRKDVKFRGDEGNNKGVVLHLRLQTEDRMLVCDGDGELPHIPARREGPKASGERCTCFLEEDVLDDV